MGSCLLLNLFYLNKPRFIMHPTHFKILFLFVLFFGCLLFVCFFGKWFLSSFSPGSREQWSNEGVIDFCTELLTLQQQELCAVNSSLFLFVFLPHENVVCLFFFTFSLHIIFYKLISMYRIFVCVWTGDLWRKV